MDIIVKALKNAYVSQKTKDEIILHTDLDRSIQAKSLKT